MTDSAADTSMAGGPDSPSPRAGWEPPTLTFLGDARTLTEKGNPVGPDDVSGGAGDESP